MGQQPEPASLRLHVVFCLHQKYWSDNLKWKKRGVGRRLTAGQQLPPQQDSPATQNELPQHEDPAGMQKLSRPEETGMQHTSVLHISKFLYRVDFKSATHPQGCNTRR